jgi:RNA polymerase sigma factor (sigma-70 family)
MNVPPFVSVVLVPEDGYSPRDTMTQELSDHKLMICVRDGEIDRLGELFERNHRALYGFFVHLTGQRTQSEDLVQQVFFRILKYRHTYRDEGNFGAWMYHLGRRLVADHVRKNRRQPASCDAAIPLETIVDPTADSAERATKQDDIALMQSAIAQLNFNEREILTLHRFQRLPLQEIATLLNCSLGAAKVRTHRALRALREIYLRLSQAQGLRKNISHEL